MHTEKFFSLFAAVAGRSVTPF